jgi:dipeptidase
MPSRPVTLHSDGGQGAIWCAQRVEDNEFVVVANMMVIRQVDLSDGQVMA